MEKEVNFYSLERLSTNPDWFESTTVHDTNLSYDLKDIFYKEEKPVLWTNKWPKDVKIYYSEIWELEPILFWTVTWVIRKDLIEEFEKELWKKIYKEIEFLPVEIVPEWWLYEWDYIKEWSVLKDYYLAHVLKRIDDEKLKLKDCKKLEEYDFIWMPDWANIMFSERVKKIIERQKLKVFKIFNIDICEYARMKETEEWRKELEQRKKDAEKFHKETEELRKWMKKAQEEFDKKMKEMWIDLEKIRGIGRNKE